MAETSEEPTFLYFFAVILILIILPLAYHFLRYRLFSAKNSTDTPAGCSCSHCSSRRSKSKHKFPTGTVIELLVLLLLIYVFYLCIASIQDVDIYSFGFDPYEILGVDLWASETDIKKAYRTLSRRYHPDKVKGTENKFILINKAYHTLTDKKAWQNYQKYGNPDGPTGIKFGIGLPSFMLNPENHVFVLSVFFIVLIVLIPGAVIYWMTRSRGISKENFEIYTQNFVEELDVADCLYLVALTQEFDFIKTPFSENEEMLRMNELYIDYIPEVENLHPRVLKIIFLLASHMNRESVANSMKKDREFLVNKANEVINVIKISAYRAILLNLVNVSASSFITLTKISQCITQGLSIGSDPLKMLSDKLKGKLEDVRNEVNMSQIDQDSAEDVKEIIRHLPQLSVKCEIVGKKEAYEDEEVIEFKISIERLHLNQGQKAGMVHSLVIEQFETIWLMIIDPSANQLFYIMPNKSQERIISDISFAFKVGNAYLSIEKGRHVWEVIVMSDSYLNTEASTTVEFNIK